MLRSYVGMKNKHEGETGLVVANGPSLADVPKSFLRQYPRVCMNHYACACEHSIKDPPPTYWVQTGFDQVDTQEKREHYYPTIEVAELAFVNKQVVDEFPHENTVGILSRGAQGKPMNPPYMNREFSTNPLDVVGIGFTNTYVALQIAYWLGFETVLIVGLDNTYRADPDKRHYYPDEEHNSTEPYGGHERFEDGSDYVFKIARQAFEADGRRIVNLTEGSKADAFEMGEIDEWA